jgi:hypothetical protein
MTLGFGSLRNIRSARQRALADYWDQLADGRLFPELKELKEIDGLHDPRQLVVFNVEGQGRLRKFTTLYQGEHIAEVFHLAWMGKTLEAIVPMALRNVSLEAAKECAASGCLVYTILSTFDASDHRIECGRLLLPFGRGAKVEQILMSLHLTETRGRLSVLKHFEMHTDTVLQVKIRSSSPSMLAQSGKGRMTAVGVKLVAGAGEKRRAKRASVRRAARISFARQKINCLVYDFSAKGAAIEAPNPDAIPDDFRLVMEMESLDRPCRVVWRRKSKIGVQFK